MSNNENGDNGKGEQDQAEENKPASSAGDEVPDIKPVGPENSEFRTFYIDKSKLDVGKGDG
jgi:hypothetical protein